MFNSLRCLTVLAKTFLKKEIWISYKQHIFICKSVTSEWMQTFSKTKAEFQIQKHNKNIHSQEAKEGFKGHKMAESFSPAPSVSLTGCLKSCLNHRKTVQVSFLFKNIKKKKNQCKFS